MFKRRVSGYTVTEAAEAIATATKAAIRPLIEEVEELRDENKRLKMFTEDALQAMESHVAKSMAEFATVAEWTAYKKGVYDMMMELRKATRDQDKRD